MYPYEQIPVGSIDPATGRLVIGRMRQRRQRFVDQTGLTMTHTVDPKVESEAEEAVKEIRNGLIFVGVVGVILAALIAYKIGTGR